MKIKYSITELLALQRNAATDLSQFTAYALETDLLRHHKSRSTTDPDLTSSEARHTEHSMTTSDGSFQKPALRRQMDFEDKEAGSDAGFVNFLKQHTSPKHQRVTPGGKIVHVDGKIPIPEFKPPTAKKSDDLPQKTIKVSIKTADLQETRSEMRTAENSRTSSNSNNTKFDSSSSGAQERFATGPTAIRTGVGSDEVNPQIGTFYPSSHSLPQPQHPPMASDIYRHQPLPWVPGFSPIFQVAQPGQDALGTASYHNYSSLFLPDTTAWYQHIPQAHFNQNAAILQNFSQQQSAPLLATVLPTVGRQGAVLPPIGLPDPTFAMSAPNTFHAPNTLTNQMAPLVTTPYSTSLPAYHTDRNTQRSLQDSNKEYQSLSTQLLNLDRYMAIHTFEMDAETKRNLVEQRRVLVKDLDIARRYKEHLESSLRFSATSVEAAPRTTLQQGLPGDLNAGNMSYHYLPYLHTTEPLGHMPRIPNIINSNEYPYGNFVPQDSQFAQQNDSLTNTSNNTNTTSQPSNIDNQQTRVDISEKKTSTAVIQRSEGSFMGTSSNSTTGSGASKTSSASWIVVEDRSSSTKSSAGAPRRHGRPSQKNSSLRPEKSSKSFREAQTMKRDGKTVKKFQVVPSEMLTRWPNHELSASKACAPIISRVNAHGFLPSFDGAGDDNMVLTDLDDSVSRKALWYQKPPRPEPDRSEVRQFFLRIAEEERQTIQKYQTQPKENQPKENRGVRQ